MEYSVADSAHQAREAGRKVRNRALLASSIGTRERRWRSANAVVDTHRPIAASDRDGELGDQQGINLPIATLGSEHARSAFQALRTLGSLDASPVA